MGNDNPVDRAWNIYKKQSKYGVYKNITLAVIFLFLSAQAISHLVIVEAKAQAYDEIQLYLAEYTAAQQ